MHADAFDRYHDKESFVHRLDPRVKTIVTVVFIVSNALLPDGAWLAFVLAWVFLLGINLLSNLGFMYTFKRSFVALPFALVAVTVLFSIPGNPVSSFHFLMWDFTITDAGLLRFVSILIRSWLSVQMAIMLVAVTRFPDLIHALEHLHVPAILTTIIAFLYRYLFVLVDEVYRLLRARESRSAAVSGQRSGGSVVWRAKVAGNMAGQLFLRSYERSDRIYNAMLSRGYTGHLYTLNPHEMKSRDYLVTALVVVLIFVMQILGRL
ncbi:MAG TPA: cobalt ECF transporter T component CbiQ [Anaerolineales bacterium]|nr:cobalt ECF transporter T component CbiQ [Anaerolineales bacterium]HMV95264.1 cobalt ECF transporter T component CbiQ [Anaerolineales bacterium]HMX19084.1 cobalt ECF transporter T component CbiQ [Anaerolineales bacterium]HMZ43036.1 cobalt ECF transporter T component CbiQ [Anaerolineales bacterium]HNC88747.1 cobalt ECF transporter T component CbiQ [Anaerolineales bacterium]